MLTLPESTQEDLRMGDTKTNTADELRREITQKIAGILGSQQGRDAGLSNAEAIDEPGTIALNYSPDNGDDDAEFFVVVEPA